MKTKAFDLDVKAVEPGGGFTGYASVFGNIDAYREIVAPGAFTKTLKETEKKGRTLPILWHHDLENPIGSWTSLKEDDHGLLGAGELWLEESATARVAYRGMQSKSVTGLSIGYNVRDDSFDEKERVRTLKDVHLVEASIVTNPANDDARVDAVKALLAEGGLPSMKEFEGVLREAGFSKTRATVITSRGYAHLLRRESGDDGERKAAADRILALCDGFTL